MSELNIRKWDDKVRGKYFSGDTAAEVFAAASQWISTQANNIALQGVNWHVASPDDDYPTVRYELAVYFHPT